ncbi:MAG: hypothetical protein ACR2QF_10700 [Geminicoccaceae bacterium]
MKLQHQIDPILLKETVSRQHEPRIAASLSFLKLGSGMALNRPLRSTCLSRLSARPFSLYLSDQGLIDLK